MTNRARLDPQALGSVRRPFVADVKRRMNGIKKSIRTLVIADDAFGLTERTPMTDVKRLFGNVEWGAWAASSPSEKVKKFEEFLQQLTETGDYALVDGFHGEYIESAHMLGTKRGSSAGAVGRGEVLSPSTFAAPKAAARAELLYTRSLSKLVGLTTDMSDKLTDVLSRSFIDGRNPRRIVTEMVKTVDSLTRRRALTIARTELAYAYAEGQLDGMEADGREQVKLFAEWSTAGDDRVCPKCQPMDGKILSIEDARGLIPLHPNCRCAWIPITQADLRGQRERRRREILEMKRRRWERTNGPTPPPPAGLPRPSVPDEPTNRVTDTTR